MRRRTLLVGCLLVGCFVFAQDSDVEEAVESKEATTEQAASSDQEATSQRGASSAQESSSNERNEAKSQDRFDPTEDISEDYAVPFPTDI